MLRSAIVYLHQVIWFQGSLVGFYGISIFVVYLMPNSVYTNI